MMLTLLAIAAVAWPKTMATSLGGIKVQGSLQYACWNDPKSGYFLMTANDCDGSHKSINLTKDRREISELFDTNRFGRKSSQTGAYYQIKDRAIPLVTGSGIRIGMSKSDLLHKLGKPTKTAIRGKSREFWCAMYKKVKMQTREEGEVLRNTYIFKNSKLIEISINYDSVPGCGDDSLSDEGWPWTHF